MLAKDVMTRSVVTIRSGTQVQEIARTLSDRRISAVPVVDKAGAVVGMVSEDDLLRRPENAAGRRSSWWLQLFAEPEEPARAYVKTHGRTAAEVMTSEVVSVGEDTPLEEIAILLERHRIKRVPVVRDGQLIGLVSRADLLQGLVSRAECPPPSASDGDIRLTVEEALDDAGVRRLFVNVIVSGGVVHLWGAVESEVEKQAARIAAERVAGVERVEDRLGVAPEAMQAALWA